MTEIDAILFTAFMNLVLTFVLFLHQAAKESREARRVSEGRVEKGETK